MKQVLGTWCAIFVLMIVGGARSSLFAQVASSTPDPFAVQLTSSPAGFNSAASDMSANGRFVVFESNGDVSTEKTATRNNADGNREIFLADYAQRRIFQITNTKSVAIPTPTPSPTPSPSPTASPSPTPSPVPTPPDLSKVKIEISNNRPMISLEPQLVGGKRVYVIVFSSNAPNPKSFDGTDNGTLDKDANQEIWIYEVPAVADAGLTSGADLPLIDLSAGTFTQITDSPASIAPIPGSTTAPPFVADDNRDATISDDGNRIAFVSTRNLLNNGNTDGSPEIFLFNRLTAAFSQLTSTQDVVDSNGRLVFSVFTANPSLSSDGSLVAFISNANLTGDNDDGNGRGNGEIYLANYNGSSFSNLRQLTKTKTGTVPVTVNLLSFGRRLSRDGSLLTFESLADDPAANSTTNQTFFGIFVVNTSGTPTFNLVKPRATTDHPDLGFIHFPTFTDYTGLQPGAVIFSSFLNFKSDGTFPTTQTDGLNPNFATQIFSTPLPISSSSITLTRLTRNPGTFQVGIRALAGDNHRRIAFSASGLELGGGNADFSSEVFYLLQPPDLVESPAALTFFTGASNVPVPAASPGVSPTPTPSPSPSATPFVGAGLAPGELSIVRSTVDLSPSNVSATGASETRRSPALPVELNGVSVAVNGAAAGLYFVGNSPQQINFVVPIGVALGSANVVINNNGTVFRAVIQIVGAQPDIFTSTMDAGGRAMVFNVTNPLIRSPEPFSVKTDDGTGNLVPTVLEIDLTGVRTGTISQINASQVTVTIGTSTPTNITPVNFVGFNPEMPGFDIIKFTLPNTLAGAGDVPITVKVASGSSRPADSAPHITINP